jgi:carbonic anhydrase
LQRGEALVIRNIGGRITPGAMQTIAMLGAIAQNEGVDPGAAGMEIIVLQHIDCGITRLHDHPDVPPTASASTPPRSTLRR